MSAMETPISALPVGSVLRSPENTYSIIKVIGSGGFGITYLATVDIIAAGVPAKALVAIKEHFLSNYCVRGSDSQAVSFSNPSASSVTNSLKDFLGEAHRLKKLTGKHSSIVNVSEVFEANNTAYYVMEYLHGQSLRDYVQTNGTLDMERTLEIMLPIIDAVAYLHANHTTHLDIKPNNIMLVTDEPGKTRPVLIDFGLSKHYNVNGDATATINTMGFSDGYSPVEQYEGITKFSPTADVYSLGATTLYCLTGTQPPKANTVYPEVLRDIIPATVPESFRECIVKAMSMRIADRYRNASELYSLLTQKPSENLGVFRGDEPKIEAQVWNDGPTVTSNDFNNRYGSSAGFTPAPNPTPTPTPAPTPMPAATPFRGFEPPVQPRPYDAGGMQGKHSSEGPGRNDRHGFIDIPISIDMGDKPATHQKPKNHNVHSLSDSERKNGSGESKVKKFAVALLIILLAAAIGAGGWYLFEKLASDTSISDDTEQADKDLSNTRNNYNAPSSTMTPDNSERCLI